MKPKPKKGRPSLEDDQRALLGLWIQPPEPGYGPKILHFSEGFVQVCDFAASTKDEAKFHIHFSLVEEDGERRMLDRGELEGGVKVRLFTYRLEGDTLELHWEAPAGYEDYWNLSGKWHRLHYR